LLYTLFTLLLLLTVWFNVAPVPNCSNTRRHQRGLGWCWAIRHRPWIECGSALSRIQLGGTTALCPSTHDSMIRPYSRLLHSTAFTTTPHTSSLIAFVSTQRTFDVPIRRWNLASNVVITASWSMIFWS